jgi:hypothetical protein
MLFCNFAFTKKICKFKWSATHKLRMTSSGYLKAFILIWVEIVTLAKEFSTFLLEIMAE